MATLSSLSNHFGDIAYTAWKYLMTLHILGGMGEFRLGMGLQWFVDRTHGMAQYSHHGNWLAQHSVGILHKRNI
jgi:hypothetical protein